jgi:hypothetical protein
VVSGGPGDEEGNAYAAMLLAEFLILIGWAQQRAMPMVCYHYLGCVLVLQLFGGGREEQESSKLWNGRFYRVSG